MDVLFRGKKYSSEFDRATLQDRYRVWRGIDSVPGNFEPQLSENERRNAHLETLEFFLSITIVGQSMFFTREKSLGAITTCSGAVVGDEVYVLLGGNTPFILRPRVEEQSYQLIAPCYLHDYMDGKAISMWRKGELELKTVHLV
jgi:hypothetical protein